MSSLGELQATFGRAMLGNLNAATESTNGKNKPRAAAKV